MRLNAYIAKATGVSRRRADKLIAEGRVELNGAVALVGSQVSAEDKVAVNHRLLELSHESVTILLNKPVGYVVSREGQGAQTVYDLLPEQYRKLKPVGRLDKDSSGLLLLTNDGQLHQQMTHPSFAKQKIYHVRLNRPLNKNDMEKLIAGIKLDDGISKLALTQESKDGLLWQVSMHEGRNRQIRRSFAKLGYKVEKLHRSQFGTYLLNELPIGHYKQL